MQVYQLLLIVQIPVTLFILWLQKRYRRQNYKVREELSKYSSKLIKKKEIIVFNKTDLIDKSEINKKIKYFKNKVNKKVYLISTLKKNTSFLFDFLES